MLTCFLSGLALQCWECIPNRENKCCSRTGINATSPDEAVSCAVTEFYTKAPDQGNTLIIAFKISQIMVYSTQVLKMRC